jgi:hypothetical protein
MELNPSKDVILDAITMPKAVMEHDIKNKEAAISKNEITVTRIPKKGANASIIRA